MDEDLMNISDGYLVGTWLFDGWISDRDLISTWWTFDGWGLGGHSMGT